VIREKLIEVRNLKTYFYTDRGVSKAIDGVDFEIYPGETLGLVGESGCGKSVTAISIMQLIEKPAGKIVNGQILFHLKKPPSLKVVMAKRFYHKNLYICQDKI